MTEQDKSIAWWNGDKNRKHEVLFNWVNYVATQTRTLRMDTRIFIEAVSNFNPTGNSDFSYALRSSLPHKIRDNILAAGRDTVASMVSQARTSPQYLTTAAQWGTSRIAEKRSRVLQGQMYDLHVFDIVPRAFVDACEAGTGYVTGCINRNGMPELQRALPNEVFVDPEDGRYGDPNTLARVSFPERSDLLAGVKDPELRRQILLAGGPTNQDYMDFFIQRNSRADRVRLVEAWRRPSAEGADDGVYVKAVSTATLVEKPFTRRRIPVIRVLYSERSQGYHGQGLVERMLPAQLRLNETDEWIYKVQKLTSGSKWMNYANSGIDPDDITNDVQVLDGVREPGLEPKLVTYAGTPPDLSAQRRETKSDVMDQEGLSQNATTGDVNKGLSSARAVRAADDTMVRRFISPARLLEKSYLEVVRLIEDLNDDCAALDANYAPKGRYRSGRRTWLKTSKWTDLTLTTDDAAVQMFPISAQATTPQGKWSSVEEWVQSGFVSKPQAMDLMEFPDTEAFEALENANLDLVHEQIDALIDEDSDRDDLMLPFPNQDLGMAKYFVNNAQLVAQRLRAPDEVLLRFDKYLANLKQKEDELAAAGASQPQAGNPAALNQAAAAAAQMQAGAVPAQGAVAA